MQAQRAEGTKDLIGRDTRLAEDAGGRGRGVRAVSVETIETPAIEQLDVFVHGIGQSTDVVRQGDVPRLFRR